MGALSLELQGAKELEVGPCLQRVFSTWELDETREYFQKKEKKGGGRSCPYQPKLQEESKKKGPQGRRCPVASVLTVNQFSTGLSLNPADASAPPSTPSGTFCAAAGSSRPGCPNNSLLATLDNLGWRNRK